ncbi:MAG: 5-(carboxyamino)imidazole ribonucleotide mutase [bacterium]
MPKIIIIMGSKTDLKHGKAIKAVLENFGVEHQLRVASAHKTPLKVLKIIEEFEKDDVVYITIAGRSNALSGFVDANATKPVIACPPYSEKFSGVDIFSSLRMPSGVCPMTILEPESAALAAIKILALSDKNLEAKIRAYQEAKEKEIEDSDREVSKDG